MTRVPPPPNDDFANAIPFSTTPFADSEDLTAATIQPGEPTACGTSGSAWYAFTPAISGSYGSANSAVNAINVYTGTSLIDLTPVACSSWYGVYFWGSRHDLLPAVLRAEACL